ncbi:MAG: ATP-binding protein [Chloroflexi bacterium]|nr:ATP-binding protein [Chloroflexota bacterium]
MPIPSRLQEMVRSSESINVDFKVQIPPSLSEHIMGFANRYGGNILIGVEEVNNLDGSQSGNVVGFESGNIDEDKQKVDNMASALRPAVKLLTNQEYKLTGNKWLLHIEVAEQTEKPVGTAAGLYKIRTHSGTVPMDHSAMRLAVFEEERALISLRDCLERNIKIAASMLTSINSGLRPLNVFEKATVLSALAAPDVYEKMDRNELAAAYQSYEIVERVADILITISPIGIPKPDLDRLLKLHAEEALAKSSHLVDAINQFLK